MSRRSSRNSSAAVCMLHTTKPNKSPSGKWVATANNDFYAPNLDNFYGKHQKPYGSDSYDSASQIWRTICASSPNIDRSCHRRTAIFSVNTVRCLLDNTYILATKMEEECIDDGTGSWKTPKMNKSVTAWDVPKGRMLLLHVGNQSRQSSNDDE